MLGDVGERLLPLDPAVAGDDDPGVLVDDVVFLAILDRGRGAVESSSAARRRRRRAICLQLVPDDLPAGRLVGEQGLDLGGPAALRGQLVEDVLRSPACPGGRASSRGSRRPARSERPNRSISLGAASALPSLARMIRIASSRLLKTIAKPSRMWIRRSRFSSSCWSRRVTTSSRKSRKWSSIALRSSRAGTATSAPSAGSRQVRLTLKLVWSGVFLNR